MGRRSLTNEDVRLNSGHLRAVGSLVYVCQDKASNDLNTLLRDASYVFNRFDEVSLE